MTLLRSKSITFGWAPVLVVQLFGASPAIPIDDHPRSSARDLARSLGSGFAVTSSAHFDVISNVGAAGVADLLRMADATFDRVAEFARSGGGTTRPTAFMNVIYFDTWPQYQVYAAREKFVVQEVVAGFF